MHIQKGIAAFKKSENYNEVATEKELLEIIKGHLGGSIGYVSHS